MSSNWITDMGIIQFVIDNPEKEYPNVCFKYILRKPVKDGLVKDQITGSSPLIRNTLESVSAIC